MGLLNDADDEIKKQQAVAQAQELARKKQEKDKKLDEHPLL